MSPSILPWRGQFATSDIAPRNISSHYCSLEAFIFKILLPPMEHFYAGRVDVGSVLSEVPMMGPNKISVRRRQFLRVLGTGAGVAATTKFDASLRAASPTDTQFQPEHLKPRYRETGHVMTFYRLSRYEGGAAC